MTGGLVHAVVGRLLVSLPPPFDAGARGPAERRDGNAIHGLAERVQESRQPVRRLRLSAGNGNARTGRLVRWQARPGQARTDQPQRSASVVWRGARHG